MNIQYVLTHTYISGSLVSKHSILGIPELTAGCVLREHMNIVFHMTCGTAGEDLLCVWQKYRNGIESEIRRRKTFE